MILPSSFKKKSAPLKWAGRPLGVYSLQFSLDRLKPGVDNFHIDVNLSPDFCEAFTKISLQLIVKQSRAADLLKITSPADQAKEKEGFKRCYREMMLEAINKAKLDNEVQIDYLAQIATVKKVSKDIRTQFEFVLSKFNSLIWESETSKRLDMHDTLELKEKNAAFRKQKKTIIDRASREIFQYMAEVQAKDLAGVRAVKFGTDLVLPDHVFFNPILQTDQVSVELMLENYVILGRRLADADRYDPLLTIIRELLLGLDIENQAGMTGESDPADDDKVGRIVDGWIKHVANFDVLLNWFALEKIYHKLKAKKGNEDKCRILEKQIESQKKIMDRFCQRFEEADFFDRIAASFEMQAIVGKYCPPLAPHQVLMYLVEPKTRKDIAGQLERLNKFYGKSFSMVPLQDMIKSLARIKIVEKQEYLLRYLKGFARYHRDFENNNVIRSALERINLVTEEKTLNLSRANNTLYEFILPEEQVLDLFGGGNKITGHVIVKSDVRGATDITRQLQKKGLNPASHFSLNFFDPISGIFSDYGAEKVFIEGDAIILAIYEHQDDPRDRYSVARACGLSATVLNVIKQYNIKSKKYKLPELELGFGITCQDSPPAFLFDGDHRIVISPAINQAARLSDSSKSLRRLLDKKKYAFNTYVCQTVTDAEIAATGDDIYWRYNVNGIELSLDAFNKLSGEIDLKVVECTIPELSNEKFRLYTGKFPALSGKFQRLVIREDEICEVSKEDISVIRRTGRKYYEVCTDPILFNYLRKKI